jgi:hypothetical protein
MIAGTAGTRGGLWLVVALVTLAGVRADEPAAWSIAIDPGDVDRCNLPVRVPLANQGRLALVHRDDRIRLREEMARAQDLGNYYLIPADNRNLNYEQFFSQGEEKISYSQDYTSHNTQRLDIAGVQSTLKNLSLIQGALKELPNQRAPHG